VARIDPLRSSEDELGQKILDAAEAIQPAPPRNLFGTLAHHPQLARRALQLGTVFLMEGRLPPRQREIAILRTAWKTEAEYEWGQHRLLGRQAGLSDTEITALMTPAIVGSFSNQERAVALAVDDICDHGAITMDTWVLLVEEEAEWGEADFVELTMLVGYYRMLAALMNSVEIELDEGVPSWTD
jgi:alkylhydroperoxidase family enzyme